MKRTIDAGLCLVLTFVLAGCGGSAAVNRELQADANTIALWHFNEESGQTAADSSGNGRDLVLGNAAGRAGHRPGLGGLRAYRIRQLPRLYRQ